MSRTTTEPAPMVQLLPMVTPGKMVVEPPIQQLLQNLLQFSGLVGRRVVESPQNIFARSDFAEQRFVAGIVNLSSEHFLFFGLFF